MADVSKRLCFEDVSLHLPEFIQIQDVMQAISNPCVDNFRSATQNLQAANHDRFVKLRDVAREQSAGSGESDLRRMKRQFASLKNTFILYDVKETFIDGLAEGCPDGTEDSKVAEYDAEVEKHAALVKKNKGFNTEVQADVEEYIKKISTTFQEFGQQEAKIFAQLDSLEQLLQEQEAAALQPLPELADGPDEAACRLLQANEQHQARSSEATLASQQAEATELLAATASEEEEMQSLAPQIEQLRNEKDLQPGDSSVRSAENLEWCEEMVSLHTTYSNVTYVSAKDCTLHFRIQTPSADSTEAKPLNHDLMIRLEESSCDLLSAELLPADVDVKDIVDAAVSEKLSLSFLLREVQLRLRTYIPGAKSSDE